jgi:hypothetical protein
MYRMEYKDDPPNIMTLVDRDSGNWELDDDGSCLHSEPTLPIINLDSIESHLLFIPYQKTANSLDIPSL